MSKQYADAEYQRKRRAAETPEQKEERLERQRERRAAKRLITPAKKPGRKPVVGDNPQLKSVYLTQAHVAKAKRLGNSISEGVRIALDMAKEPR